MNRIDRLNALRILLESRRLITAQEISAHFGLSLRTVYRDIASLQEAGIAIEGEAGIGYRMSRHAELRPVSFQSSEAISLILAAKVVERHLDSYHTGVFASAIRKIRAALPLSEKDALERLENKIALPEYGVPRKGNLDPSALAPIQQALLGNHALSIVYHSGTQDQTIGRQVIPIGILFYGGYWHMIAFCQLRSDYRDFRIDRIRSVEPLAPHQKKDLLDLESYMRSVSYPAQHSRISQSLTECKFLISPAMYNSFERTRFHYGFVRQRTLDAGEHQGWTEAVCYFDDIDEIARWLLSFTQHVHLLGPATLVKRHQELRQEFAAY